jgi:hypothetical protein
MTKQPPTLEERIDTALQPGAAVTSADLTALIEEVETDIAKADQGWRTVDQTPSPDPVAARQAIIDATLAANRLRPLLPELQERYEQVHEREQAAEWRAEREAAWLTKHDALKRERDALAEELRELYPDAVSKIVDVFDRIAVNNEALAERHRDRPAGMEQHLVSAELHARGRDSFSRDTPSLLASVHLVDWETGRQICPPQRPSMTSAFAAMVPAHPRSFTADWAKDNERRAAGQQVEGQRMADFYARQTQQQEVRENKEARERFDESQRKKQGG